MYYEGSVQLVVDSLFHFQACGIVILGVGIWIKSDTDFSNLGNAVRLATDEPVVEIVTWTFIGIGIFVLAVAFAGFIGVIRESKIIMGFVSDHCL